MSEMKTNIIQILDGDNDGLRTLAIKFVELMVLCQTHAEEYGKSSGPNDFRYIMKIKRNSVMHGYAYVKKNLTL